MKTKAIEPTKAELNKCLFIIFGLFVMTVLTLAGADLIDQLMLWIY